MVLGDQWSVLRYFVRTSRRDCRVLGSDGNTAGGPGCLYGRAFCLQAGSAGFGKELMASKTHSHKGKRRVSLIFCTAVVALLSISAISVDQLKAHVTWLADPARAGRYAGSPG